MSEPGGAEEYFRAVEEEFVRRRGAPLLLSPRDWALLASWREMGVPLRVVLQAIGNVFDAFERRAPAGRRVNSLSYCRQEVLSLFDLYRAVRGSEAGRPAAPAEGGAGKAVARHLSRLLRRVREAMAVASGGGHDPLVAALAETLADLRRMRAEIKRGRLDPRSIEAALRAREEAVLRAARSSLTEDDRRAGEAGADRVLAGERGRMAPGAYATTRAAALAAGIRNHFSLPRLTLFD